MGDLRAALVEASKAAGEWEERTRQAFAAPYSGFDAAKTFFEARGVRQGLARALEIVDAHKAGAGVDRD